MIKKVEQLVRVADILIQGNVNDFPKNLITFKTVLEGVKIELENIKEDVPEQVTNDSTIKPGDLYALGKMERSEPVAPIQTQVDIEDTPKPKRKRRTKEEMAAARAAEAKLNEVEDKIDEAIERIQEASGATPEQKEAVAETVAASIKAQEVNAGEKEDWEQTLEDEINEVTPVEEPTQSKEDLLSELLGKYPHPFNLSHLETKAEKQAFMEDVQSMKGLVGNESTKDLKNKLLQIELPEQDLIRIGKFLTVLPALEMQVK